PTRLSRLPLHDALPLSGAVRSSAVRSTAPRPPRPCRRHAGPSHGLSPPRWLQPAPPPRRALPAVPVGPPPAAGRAACPLRSRSRSEEHTSELQSRENLV